MDTPPATDNRVETRSNLFVMAALYTGGGSVPVRIRNMSASGALVEAADLPAVGTQVRLSRGSISVTGEIVWADKQKAGMHFDSPTAPNDWMPRGNRGSGQQLADEVVHQTRLGSAVRTVAPSASVHVPQLSEELLRLHDVLMRAGEELASSDGLTASHLLALQEIDLAAQRLAKLAGEGDGGKPASFRPAP